MYKIIIETSIKINQIIIENAANSPTIFFIITYLVISYLYSIT